jgi:hypothetical protein
MTIKSSILQLFSTIPELSVKEATDKLRVSKQMVHIAMKQLLEEGRVIKLGRTPKTIYRLKDKPVEAAVQLPEISAADNEFLQHNFLIVTETGDLMEGLAAFSRWCRQRKLPVEKTLAEFKLTKQKYAPYYDQHSIVNGLDKLKNTKGYNRIGLDELCYLDFYAIERFGKTRLGTLLHYAKQGQNKFLMQLMMDEITDRIKSFIQQQRADAIAYVPPTIRREVQLMKFMENVLKISLPVIDLKKISGIIPVPQKSLTKLEERITNAENTFAVTEQRNFKKVVLIDDAVGSGSTMNEIALKMKDKGVTSYVTGLAIVGSFKGFDVITDV